VPSLEMALNFVRHKQAIIPVWWAENGVCQCPKRSTCPHPAKHPCYDPLLIPDGINSKSRDPALIVRWWRKWPKANIGIATGIDNHLIVIDVDVRDGKQGRESLKILFPEGPPEDTFMVQTGSGGWHYYFRTKEPVTGRNPLLPGIELKGEGGYVLAPSSVYQDGSVYRILNPVQPKPVPANVLQMAAQGPLMGTGPVAEYDAAAGVYRIDPAIFGREPVTEEEWERPIEDGERNVTLTRLAGKLFHSQLPPKQVYRLLSEQNRERCQPPFTDHEIKVIVRSVYRTSKKRAQERAQEQDKTLAADAPAPIGKPITAQVAEEAEKAFPLLTFGQFVDAYSDYEASWDIEGWLPRATICYAVAPPESWKTWFLTDYALAMSTGQPFLQRYPVARSGPVILVQQEDNFSRLLRRMEIVMNLPPVQVEDGLWKVPMPDEPPLLFYVERQFSLADRKTVLGLDRMIRKHKAVGVTFDPMFSILGDVKDFGADGATKMKLLKLMRDHLGCSFLIAHHTNRGNGEGRGRDQGWGSQLLLASLESGWQIRPRELKGSLSVERHFKDEDKPPPLHVQFTITNGRYVVEIEEETQIEEGLDEKIKDVINAEEITSLAQLMQKTGNKSRSQHQAAMKRLGVGKLGNAYAIMKDFKLTTNDLLPKGLKE
jgi:hypothetical protein